jgi:BlaI family transcriptional regulator, penicillinase repressor
MKLAQRVAESDYYALRARQHPTKIQLNRGDSNRLFRGLRRRRPLFFLTALGFTVTCCNATMTNTSQLRLRNLGAVEQLVMDYIWNHGPSSAEACREAMASSRPMKDSTIRTVLRRLEEKGYLTHAVEGRTFIYRAADGRQNVAVRAVKNIIDRFCGGSAEALVLGMVDNAVLDRKQLERLARKIAAKKDEKP